MLREKDRKKIEEISRKFGAKLVLLFGSSLEPGREGRDIDLAVEGVAPGQYWDYYGELFFSLSKPVDLVNLSIETPFTRIVRREGKVIYGAA